MPAVPAVGVPLSTPVEALNDTPVGSVPDTLSVGTGVPVAVTVKEPGAATVKVVLLGLVIAAAWLTVRVKLCVALGDTPLAAAMVIGYEPPVPAAGVPLRTPPALKVTPDGKAPVSLKVGAGKPVAVTLNDPAVPTVNVMLFPLVIAGA